MFELENERDEMLSKIEEYLQRKHFGLLRKLLSTLEAADVALLMEDLTLEQIPLVFRLLTKELAAEVFVELDSDQQELLIQGFSIAELRDVLEELYLDDTVDIVEEMPASVVKRILQHSDPEMRKRINELLQYPEDSAGSIMTTEFVDLKVDMTVSDAFRRIRLTGPDKETINIGYVINADRRLVGIVTIRQLLLAKPEELIGDIMKTNPLAISTLDDQELAARNLAKYDFLALPVVDQENRLVGIVTVDDAIDVLMEEVTEDMEMMAAITPTDKPYLKTGIWETVKARTPWLLILMVSSTFTGQIIATFENALATFTVLTIYIPMLMGTGGNCGTQASVTIIRGISLGEMEFSDLPRIIWKESRVAICVGILLGLANYVKLMVLDCYLLGNTDVTPRVAMVICGAMMGTVFFSKVVGCTLPVLAKKLGCDPAVMAAPFLSTIVDATSLLIYFQIAALALGL